MDHLSPSSIPWSSSIDDYDMTSKLRSNLYRGRLPSVDMDLYIRAVLIPEKALMENVMERFQSLCLPHLLLPRVLHSFFSEKRLILIHPVPQSPDTHHHDDGEFLDTVHSMDEFALASVLRQVVNLLVYLHGETTDWCDLRPAHLCLRKGLLMVNLFSPRSISRFVSRDSQPFLAPELSRGQAPPNSFKGDIWSLAITAMHLYMSPAVKEINAADLPQHAETLECSKEFKSFLQTCLQVDPNLRPTAKELTEHPFLLKKRSSESVPVQKKGSAELSLDFVVSQEVPFRVSSSGIPTRGATTHSPDVVISTRAGVSSSERKRPSGEFPPKSVIEQVQAAANDFVLRTSSGRALVQSDVLLSTQGFDGTQLLRSQTEGALLPIAPRNPFSGSTGLNMIFENVAKSVPTSEEQSKGLSSSDGAHPHTERPRPLSLSLEALRPPQRLLSPLSINIEALKESPKKGSPSLSINNEAHIPEKLDSERSRRKKKKSPVVEKELTEEMMRSPHEKKSSKKSKKQKKKPHNSHRFPEEEREAHSAHDSKSRRRRSLTNPYIDDAPPRMRSPRTISPRSVTDGHEPREGSNHHHHHHSPRDLNQISPRASASPRQRAKSADYSPIPSPHGDEILRSSLAFSTPPSGKAEQLGHLISPHKAVDLSRIRLRMKLDRMNGGDMDPKEPEEYFNNTQQPGKKQASPDKVLTRTLLPPPECSLEPVGIFGSSSQPIPFAISVADDGEEYILVVCALPTTKITSYIDGDTVTIFGELPQIVLPSDPALSMLDSIGSREFKRQIKFPTLLSPSVKDPVMNPKTHALSYRIKKLLPTEMGRLVL